MKKWIHKIYSKIILEMVLLLRDKPILSMTKKEVEATLTIYGKNIKIVDKRYEDTVL